MTRAIADLLWWLCWHGWRSLRALSGDDAYDRYLASRLPDDSCGPPMPRSRFFELQVNRKWDRITACGRYSDLH